MDRFLCWRFYSGIGLLAVLLLALVLFALSIGNYPVSALDIYHFIGHQLGVYRLPAPKLLLLNDILLHVRLPRVMAAVLVGMALSTAGSAFQAIFRNPLVSPGILGVLSGAAFGAALGMLLHQSQQMLEVWAFGFGILAVFVGVGIGQLFGTGSLVMLILGGMISSALFSAMLSMVKYLADPQDQLPNIVYWLMGSLSMSTLSQNLMIAIPIGITTVILWFLGRVMDIMSMGDAEAQSLGVPVVPLRYLIIALATLASAMSVSIAGMIGWIGLLAPHVARLLFGPVNSRLLPASTLLGGCFLVIADCLSRSLASVEIPVGVVTECLGLPIFLLVLYRVKKGWS
ncbi:FecCD family ABC transporter permease [Celerinatantimonas sp. YJH-8]|uniref:FecCD family ABC transporter permease n=1 Tax=Celerinatantimonas sp. YJH-8 TaxID=3228714 RepID=UPI0038C5F6AB